MLKKIIHNLFNLNGNNPKAVQCLWHSDISYVALDIELVFKDRQGFKKQRVAILNYMDFEDHKELAKEAKKIGNSYAAKYNIELYFPSPDDYRRDCPDWWKAKDALRCEDCQTPIIPSDSNFLPKEVCYSCYLVREQNDRIKSAEPCDDGVSMYLNKKSDFQFLRYCSEFGRLTIAPFLSHLDTKSELVNCVKVITLNEKEIMNLILKLEVQIANRLVDYQEPFEEKRPTKLSAISKIEYKGIQYAFTRQNTNTYELILSYETAKKAIDEGFEYKIYLKKGFNYRDDSVLRFINYVNNGKVPTKTLKKKYLNILTLEQIEATIQKLVRIGCLNEEDDLLLIAEKGKNIV